MALERAEAAHLSPASPSRSSFLSHLKSDFLGGVRLNIISEYFQGVFNAPARPQAPSSA